MRMVKIVEDFTGYPSGKKRDFAKGEEVEVPNDFADLIITKGHAKEAGTKSADADERTTRRKGEVDRP